MLEAHGVSPQRNTEPGLKPQLCPTCHTTNPPSANFCQRCTRPLRTETMLAYNHQKQEANDLLNRIVFVNKDGSINVLLNAIPMNGKIHLRVDSPKKDAA